MLFIPIDAVTTQQGTNLVREIQGGVMGLLGCDVRAEGSVPLYLLIAAVGGLLFIWIVCRFCVPISVYTEGDSVIVTRSRVLLRIGLCTRHPIRDIRHIALDYQQTSDSEGSKRIRWSVMIVSRQRTSTYVLSRGSDARGLAEALGSVVRRENEGGGGESVSPDPRTRIGSHVDRTPEQDRTGSSPPRTPDEPVAGRGEKAMPRPQHDL